MSDKNPVLSDEGPDHMISMPVLESETRQRVERVRPLAHSVAFAQTVVDLGVAQVDVALEPGLDPERVTDQFIIDDARAARGRIARDSLFAEELRFAADVAEKDFIAAPVGLTWSNYVLHSVGILLAGVALVGALAGPLVAGVDIGILRDYLSFAQLGDLSLSASVGYSLLIGIAVYLTSAVAIIVTRGKGTRSIGLAVLCADIVVGLSSGFLRAQIAGDWTSFVPAVGLQVGVVLAGTAALFALGRNLAGLATTADEKSHKEMIARGARHQAKEALDRLDAARKQSEAKTKRLADREDAARRRQALLTLGRLSVESALVEATAEHIDEVAREPAVLSLAERVEQARSLAVVTKESRR